MTSRDRSSEAVELSHRAAISTIRGSYRTKSLSVHDGLKHAKARASRYSLPPFVAMMSSISGGKQEQTEASDSSCASAQEQFTAMFSWATGELSPIFEVTGSKKIRGGSKKSSSQARRPVTLRWPVGDHYGRWGPNKFGFHLRIERSHTCCLPDDGICQVQSPARERSSTI